MERCHGKTKAGERCKRSASEGSRYCSTHADQATDYVEPDAPEATAAGQEERDSLDALLVAAVLGAAVVVVVTFGKLLRL